VQQKKNPVFLFLGVCGGCVLIGVIGVGVLGVVGYNKGKGVIDGAVNMANNMPAFLMNLKAKNYEGAAALVNTQVAPELTAEKIKKIEEAVEKKLGPLESFPEKPESEQHSSSASADTKTGAQKMPTLEYTWKYRLKYKKGMATATFKFYESDILHMSGKVTGFDIQADGASDSTKKSGKSETSDKD
jgi:hypothetical protein